MTDVIGDIENRKAQNDLGVFAYRTFQGARADGASLVEATLIAYAWFRAFLSHKPDEDAT